MNPTKCVLLVAGLLLMAMSGCQSDSDADPTRTPQIGSTPSPAQAGPGADADQREDLGSFDAAVGTDGSWQGLIIQGLRVEVPAGDEWEVRIITDPCYGDLRRLVILRHEATGARIKVDVVEKQITTEFSGGEDTYDAVVDRINGSFAGDRTLALLPENPLPTSPACDPSVEIPVLQPVFDVTTPIPVPPEDVQTPDSPNVEE